MSNIREIITRLLGKSASSNKMTIRSMRQRRKESRTKTTSRMLNVRRWLYIKKINFKTWIRAKIHFPIRKNITAENLTMICEELNQTFGGYIKELRKSLNHDVLPEQKTIDKLCELFHNDRMKFWNEYYELWPRPKGPSYPYHHKTDDKISKMYELMKKYKYNIDYHQFIGEGVYSEEISIIKIKNLYIIGEFKALIKNFTSLYFINNIFCDGAAITGGGKRAITDEVVFRNNISYDAFSFDFSNVGIARFEKNIFKEKISVKFALESYHSENNRSIFGAAHETFLGNTTITFIKNYIKILHIDDNSMESASEAHNSFIERIVFQGDNVINSMYLNTRYNNLNRDPEKIDRKHISFHLKDIINPIYSTRDKFIVFKDYFLELQTQAHGKQDRWNEKNYERKVRYYDYFLTDRLQDEIIYCSSWLLSNNGISWIRPVLILLSFQYLAIYVTEYFIEHDFSFWRVFGELLIPISNLSNLIHEETNCSVPDWVSWINVVQKIVWATCVYEAVKALRRFSP